MRRILLLLSLLLLPATAAWGNEFTVFGGYRFGGDFDAYVSPRDPFAVALKVEEGDVLGAALDVDLGDDLALEFSVTHQETNLLLDAGFLEPGIELGNITLNYYLVGLQWQWGPGQVQPYFTLSIGAAELDPQAPGASSETRLAGAAAFGVKVFATQSLGVRLEGRGLWADLDQTDRFDRGFGYADNDLYQFELTAGLIFRF